MSTIKKIFAYEIIDSRSQPTIEARLITDDGKESVTSVPAGTSVGKYEAVELRDHDQKRFDGMGVSHAVKIINEALAPKLVGVSVLQQQEIDMWLIQADGTKNKSKLGANVTLTISQLIAKAGAYAQNIPLFRHLNLLYQKYFQEQIKLEKIPTPIYNVLNGGKHANNNLDIQEFQVIASSSLSFEKSYQLGVELFHELKRVLEYRNANVSVGEEGGFAPNLSANIDALEILNEAIIQRGLKPGVEMFFGMDMAASHYYKDQRYSIKDKPQPLTKNEYIEFVEKLIKEYAFLCLEDPLDQDDFDGWAKLNKAISANMYLIGDDLLATNKERLRRALKEKACNAILIKPNQIGTITETLEVVSEAKKNNIACVVSHRSGETNESFIADFAVAIQSEFVKFGAPSRGERVAKYNRLWQIEREELRS